MRPRSDLFEEVVLKASSKPVSTKMTREEMKLASSIRRAERAFKKAEADLKKLRKSCTHRVRYDVPGGMYDFRSCAICSKGLGAI